MRELRLKYIIQMVSDIASRAKTDEKALTLAQKAVQDALKKTTGEAGLLERTLVRMAAGGGRSAEQQAQYLARLALRYQDVRKAAEGAGKAMTAVVKIGAGVAAGAYAADRLTRAPMEYSLRLAHMANTAYADRDVPGRISGKGALNAAITAAIRVGGGSRDDAAGTLDSLIASGAVSVGDAIALLPGLMRGSTASGAPAEQLGAIALRGMQSFGLQREQIPALLNMAMSAGQAGGFELKDMAKWLPQAMAAGRVSGLSGMEGMRRIFASMQAAVITAGTKDEAGNNVVNLLAKINSSDTANDFKKLGLDLPGALAKQRAKGVNSLDAFIGFVDKIATQDPQYTSLKARLGKAGTQGERSETLQAMTDILQGKAVGKVIQDRQALMALVAEMNNREYVQRVMGATRSNTNAIGTSFDVVADEPEFKRQRSLNEGTVAAQEAFSKVAPAVNALFDTSTNLAREFPLLATGVVGATGALAVFTAALGGSGLIGLLTGRAGNAGGLLGTVAGGVRTLLGSRAGLLGLAGGLGYGAGTLLYRGALQGTSFGDSIGAGVANVMSLFGNDEAAQSLASAAALRSESSTWRASRRGPRSVPQFDTLGLTDPTGSLSLFEGQAGAAGGVGRGQLDVRVLVSDDRVTAQPLLARSMPGLRIGVGDTNPAGYGTRP